VAAGSVSAIYIAAPEANTGKSAIALGILHRLAATVARVGVFRPISSCTPTVTPPSTTSSSGITRWPPSATSS
jgi:BioD-like phosphotransacetylase family protein